MNVFMSGGKPTDQEYKGELINMEEYESEGVKHYYVMWCQPCGKAGIDSLECCENPPSEIGWVEATETTGTEG